jgi:hypothetical protein
VWPLNTVRAGTSGECEQPVALNQQAQNTLAILVRRNLIVSQHNTHTGSRMSAGRGSGRVLELRFSANWPVADLRHPVGTATDVQSYGAADKSFLVFTLAAFRQPPSPG